MKTLKITLLFFLLININAAAQWAEVNSPGSEFTDIAVISQDVCYGISETWYNNMSRTFDGGNTWSSVTVNVDTNFMTYHSAIQFITQDIGFIGGMEAVNGGSFGGGYEAPRIYKTMDGGISWSDISPPEDSLVMGSGIDYLYFFNELTGLAFDGIRIWRTTDGGASWTSQTLPSMVLRDVSFDQNGQGYVAGSGTSSNFYSQGIVVFTNDFGSTWTFNVLNNPNTRIRDVELIDQNTVYAIPNNYYHVKEEKKLFKSFDNGTTWDTIYLPMKAYNMHFFNEMEGFIVGPGDSLNYNSRIFSTIDGGQNWNLELTLSNPGTKKMRFNENAGYIHGLAINAILVAKYTDTVLTSLNGANERIFSIYPNPFTVSTTIEFENKNKEKHALTIYNSIGQLVRKIDNITTGKVEIERKNLTVGFYFFKLQNENEIVGTGKLIIK